MYLFAVIAATEFNPSVAKNEVLTLFPGPLSEENQHP